MYISRKFSLLKSLDFALSCRYHDLVIFVHHTVKYGTQIGGFCQKKRRCVKWLKKEKYSLPQP